MKVRYSKAAVRDLVVIAEYVRERDPRAAERVAQRIRASIAHLAVFPYIGRGTDDPDIRVLPVVRYPYLVFYEVAGNDVVIHHIRHARRRPVDPGSMRSS